MNQAELSLLNAESTLIQAAKLNLLGASPTFFLNGAEERMRREWNHTTASAGSQTTTVALVQASNNATDLAQATTTGPDQSMTTITDKVVSATYVLRSASATGFVTSPNTTSMTSSNAAFATSTISNTSASATSMPTGNGVAYHKVWRQLQQEFSEEFQQASWGYWYYAVCSFEQNHRLL